MKTVKTVLRMTLLGLALFSALSVPAYAVRPVEVGALVIKSEHQGNGYLTCQHPKNTGCLAVCKPGIPGCQLVINTPYQKTWGRVTPWTQYVVQQLHLRNVTLTGLQYSPYSDRAVIYFYSPEIQN